MELKVIQLIQEAELGIWIYRIWSNEYGVTVRRARNQQPIVWSHGTLVQLFDRDRGHFVPSLLAGTNTRFENLEQALQVCVPK